MSLVVKICGLTTPEDVADAVEAGADAIGINLWPGSKRFVGAAAEAVAAAVPPHVWRVGVFVNATADAIAAQVRALRLTHVQLHGDELPEDHASLAVPLLRALRIRDRSSFDEATRWPHALLLLDAFVAGYGGAGAVAPWDAIAAAAPDRPFLLAGGLDAENVAAAIEATLPSGVDVASGVELGPGKKSAAKMRAFVAAARAATRRHPPRSPWEPSRLL